MKLKLAFAIVAVATVGALYGCNSGMQPEGPSVAEIKNKEAALPPDQQITMIQNSPMPKAQKDQKIAELKKKYNIQ
jgi:hypothetical protein